MGSVWQCHHGLVCRVLSKIVIQSIVSLDLGRKKSAAYVWIPMPNDTYLMLAKRKKKNRYLASYMQTPVSEQPFTSLLVEDN